MGTFTIPLKRVIELTGGTVEIVEGVAKMTGGNIGLHHYTIFDDGYRDHLNGRIIDHYWNREIGVETVDMFQLAMRRKMNEIMPYYNKLYDSERVAYDPLSTIDIKTVTIGEATQTGNSLNESEATSAGTGEARSVNSDTPQTMLSGSGDYATSASDTQSKSDNVSNGINTATENQSTDSNTDSHTTGFQGVASALIMQYRESLLNIDLMVISELQELFMLIWDNGDSYTKNNRIGYMI